MKRVKTLLNILFLTINLFGISANTYAAVQKQLIPVLIWDSTSSFISERGLEIRYYVYKGQIDQVPSEIKINEVTYSLYKTKEDAIKAVKYAEVKRDYTIVYVISDEPKQGEIIAINDGE